MLFVILSRAAFLLGEKLKAMISPLLFRATANQKLAISHIERMINIVALHCNIIKIFLGRSSQKNVWTEAFEGCAPVPHLGVLEDSGTISFPRVTFNL